MSWPALWQYPKLRMMTDRCEKCTVKRPSWLGSPHRCPEVGGFYEMWPFMRTITEDELAWLIK